MEMRDVRTAEDYQCGLVEIFRLIDATLVGAYEQNKDMAPRDGLEPPTQWLTATCSTS